MKQQISSVQMEYDDSVPSDINAQSIQVWTLLAKMNLNSYSRLQSFNLLPIHESFLCMWRTLIQETPAPNFASDQGFHFNTQSALGTVLCLMFSNTRETVVCINSSRQELQGKYFLGHLEYKNKGWEIASVWHNMKTMAKHLKKNKTNNGGFKFYF